MAVPLRDDSPRRTVPWVVLGLIALNVAVFLLLQPASLQRGEVDADTLTAESERDLSEHYSAWGAVPCEITALESRSDGALCTEDADRPIIDRKPVPASLVTAMFLHGSLAHLALNMLFLWVFGAAVEDRFGPGPFLGLYLVGGILGTLAYVALNTGSAAPLVGASGAISAAMGAYLVIGARRRIFTQVLVPFVPVTLPAWTLLGVYAISQLVTPEDTAVAWQAHLGGMVAGFVIALGLRFFLPEPGVTRRARRRRDTALAPVDPATWTLPDRPPVEA